MPPKRATHPNTLLRMARMQRGWSQAYVAEQVGTNDFTVSRWELGQTLPNPYYRQKLCALFGLSLEALGLLSAQPKQDPPHLAAPSLISVLFPRNPFFTGREETLEHLHGILHREQAAALTQTLALSGLGGIGKTQTALEYAYRYAQQYAAVFWLAAETPESLLASFAEIAAVLQLARGREPDQSHLVAQVLRWLGSHQDWLLIVDNVEDLELVQRFLPTSPHGSLLFTTRLHALGTLALPVELAPMTEEEGSTLLLRRARRLAPGAVLEHVAHQDVWLARTLAEVLGGLPLALDQAGAYLEEVRCSLADYLQLYQAAPLRLLDERDGRSAHPASVVRTFALALEQLEQRLPVAVDLVRWCAFLAPDAIPEELLTTSAALLGPEFEALARQPLHWQDVLKALLASSLLRRHPESHTLSIHRLVQAVLKGQLDASTQRRWAERTVRAVEAVFPDGEQWHFWPQCQRYLSHALVCAQLIEDHRLILAEAPRLLYRAGAYLLARAQYPQAHALLQQALARSEQIHEGEVPEIAAILDRLAEVYRVQGQYTQALPLFLRALAIFEQTIGATHFQTGVTLNNLGVLARQQGRYPEAAAYLQRALNIYEQTVGPVHTEVASTFDNLALVFQDQGNFRQAIHYRQRALSMYEQVEEPELPDVATTLHNLAQLYRLQGAYEEAEPLYLRALALYEQVEGAEHPHTATTLYRLAQLYQAQGQPERAAALYQRALTIRETVLGVEHPQTVAVRANYRALVQGPPASVPKDPSTA